MSTGSLGQGLSVANGMALAAKLDRKAYRVYCLCGDGEMQSGQIWEAAMLAAHYKLDNVTAFVDRNRLQIDGPTEKIMSLEPLADKWKAFGWNVIEIDGHDMRQILDACDKAKEMRNRPTMVMAHTVKGKGVSFMENALSFHGKSPNEEETEKALTRAGGGPYEVASMPRQRKEYGRALGRAGQDRARTSSSWTPTFPARPGPRTSPRTSRSASSTAASPSRT